MSYDDSNVNDKVHHIEMMAYLCTLNSIHRAISTHVDRKSILRLYQLSDEIFGTMGAQVLYQRPMRTGKRFLERQQVGTDWNAYWPMTQKEFLHPYDEMSSSTQIISAQHSDDPELNDKEDEKAQIMQPFAESGIRRPFIVPKIMQRWNQTLPLLPKELNKVYRQSVVQRNIDRNKPTPKKGQGKRSAKGKSKK